MKKCPTCGQRSDEKSRNFCTKCGDILVKEHNIKYKREEHKVYNDVDSIEKRREIITVLAAITTVVFLVVKTGVVDSFMNAFFFKDLIVQKTSIESNIELHKEIKKDEYNIEEEFATLQKEVEEYLTLTIESPDIIETYENKYYDIFWRLHTVDSRYYNTSVREPNFSRESIMPLKTKITRKYHLFQKEIAAISKILDISDLEEALPMIKKEIDDYLALTVDSPNVEEIYDTKQQELKTRLEALKEQFAVPRPANELQSKLSIKRHNLKEDIRKAALEIDWVIGEIIEISGGLMSIPNGLSPGDGITHTLMYNGEMIYLNTMDENSSVSSIIRAEIMEPIDGVHVLKVLPNKEE